MDKIWLAAYPQGAAPEIDPDRYASLVSVFEESCRLYPDRPAFENLGVMLSFRDLERLSRDFGAYLLSLGLFRGDRVALMLPNILQYPVAMFGVLRAGLTVVNINPQYTPRELRHQLVDSAACCIVIVENFAHVLAAVLADTPLRHVITTAIGDLAHFPKRTVVNFVVRHVQRRVPAYQLPHAISFRTALARGAACELRPPPIAGSDIAFLQYTGGTTGVAKGAMLTHRNLVANLLQIGAFWRHLIEPGREVMVTPLPLYHIFCLTCNCLLMMHFGGLCVLITDPRDLRAFLRELRSHRFTMITGVSTLYGALLAHPDFGRLDFAALKLSAAGGMALNPSVAARWQSATGRALIEGYGLTETSPVVACNRDDTPVFGTVGLPLPSTEISIREDEVEVPLGQPGELCVRGPQVMAGYFNHPQETAAVLSPDGWLRTGDIAVIDARGIIRIVDRKKDMIIVSGFKVFPNEIESVVNEHPAVLDCGSIGVPDEHSGQAVKIFVVTRAHASITIEALREHCRQRLTAYKVPKHVEFRTSLPKTNVGKILRRKLQSGDSADAA